MFWELFRFELYYRRRRATTFVFFLVIFVTSFWTLTSPTLSITGTADSTSPNSPYTIAALMAVLSFLFSLITSSMVGVAVIRDVEHQMAPIIFTTPIHKGSYLFGRFAGSLLTLTILNTGIIFGALTAYLVGKFVPWEITWRTKEVLPFDLWTYLQPFLIYTVANIFITGSLFFAAGALVRRASVIYSQGIALLMIYQIANIFYLRDLESQHLSALLDPFGVQTFVFMTRYWTPLEQNTLLIPFEGALLYNRLIWMSIAVIVLIFTYWRFSFTSRRGFSRRKKKHTVAVEEQPPVGAIPTVTKAKGSALQLGQLISSTWFHYRGIWTEIPFLAIAGAGIIVLLVNSAGMDNMLGTSSYPTTAAVLTMLGSFSLFFSILMIFYSGEIVWKERQHKFSSIIDATPAAIYLVVLSKYLALCLVYLTFLVGFFLYGILLQASQGYFQFDLPAYFGSLSEVFINLVLVTILAMLIQAVAGNKFLGFVCTVMVVLFVALLPLFGIENEVFAYGSGSLGAFSQMNGFGHFVTPFIWLKAYWACLAVVLFVVAVIFYRRHEPLSRPLKFIAFVASLAFVGMGAYIFYNTKVLNHFENSRKIKATQLRSENELKAFESKPQPTIVEVNLNVDLFPEQRSFEAKGFYYLKNYDSIPIKEIQLQHMISPHINVHDISFGRTSTVIDDRAVLGYKLFEISPPLAPGDSLRMDFTMEFKQEGFQSKPQNTDLVFNGTFFRNDYFPKVGFSKIPERIRFKSIVSTDDTQVVLAPGHVVKEWLDNNRRYLQYEVKGTIPNYYALISGKYQVKKDKWNDVELEIYYNPVHEFNVGRMMQGLKDGLAYYTKNFGAAPQSPVRIVEFPRYTNEARSFPGIIAFSEGSGFILKVSDPKKDLDVPYYLSAHELAHQWWSQQVIEADAPGKAMLSEGLSQYSALMVVSKSHPIEAMQLFLKYELDSYVKGRTKEKMREVPLASVRDQQYISYNKSAVAFFGIQDYIGEDSLNMALRRFISKHTSKGSPNPTSKDLLNEIRKVTPDTLRYLVSDLFERITLYENKTTEAAYNEVSPTRFEATITLSTQKFQVDSAGVEKPVAINDWIDVGVYGEDEQGKPKLIYLQKHKFTRQKNTLIIRVGERPVRVGVDPLHKLIDHHSNDNVIDVGTIVEIANSPLGN